MATTKLSEALDIPTYVYDKKHDRFKISQKYYATGSVIHIAYSDSELPLQWKGKSIYKKL